MLYFQVFFSVETIFLCIPDLEIAQHCEGRIVRG